MMHSNENNTRIKAEWEKKYEKAPETKYHSACISRLRGLHCKLQFDPMDGYKWRGNPKPCDFPYADHTSMWKDRETGELVYVTQPYGQMPSNGEIEEMEAFCAEYGLEMEIAPHLSWHAPGATTFIMVRRS